MDKLTPEMKESFYDIPTLYKKMEDGYERHYLKIVAFHNGKKMAHGLACVNVDQTLQNGHRAFIRHVSVIRNELFPQALKLVTEFIWKRIYCDHIRVELFHLKDQESGKMAADPAIKKALGEMKYRWKNLSNDPATGKRSQIMQLNKPTGEAAAHLPEFENVRNLSLGKEPVTVKSGIVLELGTIRGEEQKSDIEAANNPA